MKTKIQSAQRPESDSGTISNYQFSIFHWLLAFCLLPSAFCLAAAPLGTAFTYQGRLNDGSAPAQGSYDVKFVLFDVPEYGFPVGPIITNTALPVSGGLIKVELDFGTGIFTGDARWLEISVKTNGAATFLTLAPRQLLTPNPYALYAPSAGTAATATAVAPGAVTGSGIATGQVVRSLNGLRDSVRLLPGTNVSVQAAGDAITISATPGTVVTNAGWGLSGNSSTSTNNFLGTVDGQALELRVNNARALRIEPHPASPNLIGGYAANSVASGIRGATIGGGGGGVIPHQVTADYGIVGGGAGHTVTSIGAGIFSGWMNTIRHDSLYSTIGGGLYNAIAAYAQSATIAGGESNDIGSGDAYSTIGGGYDNNIDDISTAATISGGQLNGIGRNSDYTAIGGGYGNYVGANSFYATIAGGYANIIGSDAAYSVIGGGTGNWLSSMADFGFVGGGVENHADAPAALVAGGVRNAVDPVVVLETRIEAEQAAVVGGLGNSIRGAKNAFLGGGQSNLIYLADHSFLGGGWSNDLRGDTSVISGGSLNVVESSASFASIGGGWQNTVAGDYAAIPGGRDNQADGAYSFAAGSHAKALHGGSFVWADSSSGDFASTGANQFLVRTRRAGINTTSPEATLHVVNPYSSEDILRLQSIGSNGWANLVMADGAGRELKLGFRYGPNLHGSGNSPQIGFFNRSGQYFLFEDFPDERVAVVECNVQLHALSLIESSDRNLKTDLDPVNPAAILERVVALPISTWSFTNAVKTRHLGPMAQDFHAAFGLGEDDKSISARDVGSVALAAIQGLNQKVESGNLKAENQMEKLKEELAARSQKWETEHVELRQEVAELKTLVKSLAEKVNGGGQ